MQALNFKRVLLVLGIVLIVGAGAAWFAGVIPTRPARPPQNAILVIAPYRYQGTWVFDDPRFGLVREPFVAGVPEMIDVLVADIRDAEKGFRLTFSSQEFPEYDKKLTWSRVEGSGNYYRMDDPPMEGWLCPALFKYYEQAPPEIYVKADPLAADENLREEAAKAPVNFSGGHETDPRDHGRPVVLIAGALGVTPEVFREAFSGVTPARGRGPTGEEARRNKQALMKVLGPHGVTNDRLDEVSNYYRYRPQEGEMWPTTPAEAYAVVEQGEVKRVVVTEPGSGYNSPPRVTVEGMPGVGLEAKIEFNTSLKKNGAVASISVVSPTSGDKQPAAQE